VGHSRQSCRDEYPSNAAEENYTRCAWNKSKHAHKLLTVYLQICSQWFDEAFQPESVEVEDLLLRSLVSARTMSVGGAENSGAENAGVENAGVENVPAECTVGELACPYEALSVFFAWADFDMFSARVFSTPAFLTVPGFQLPRYATTAYPVFCSRFAINIFLSFFILRHRSR